MLALIIVLVVTSSNFHTCVTNGVLPVRSSSLKMEVTSGVDKHMNAHFNLGEDIEAVSLTSYRLRVNLIVIEGRKDSDNLLEYRNGTGVREIVSSINQPLSYFTREEQLNSESEDLVIPFKLVPGGSTTKVRIQYDLLDEVGNIVSTSYVDWNSTRDDSGSISDNRLRLVKNSEVGVEAHIATIDKSEGGSNNRSITAVGTFSSEQTNMDIVEEGTDGTRKRKRSSENSSASGGSDDLLRREKVAKRLAKGKEKIKAEDKEEKEKEVLQASVEEMVIPEIYSQMSYKELARCANDNSPYAQEAIVRLCLRSGLYKDSQLLYCLRPAKWSCIEEKALKDQRYVFLLVCVHYANNLISSEFFKFPSIEKVTERVKLSAESGDALAQINLGYILLLKAIYKCSSSEKRETIEEFHQSFGWFNKAADQGNAHAQLALGKNFYAPDGIYEDHERMAFYYTQAAKQGYEEAQFLLGQLYHYGPELKWDDYEWTEFYDLLIQAKAGKVEAQAELERIYHSYINRNELDIQEAVCWYNEAAKQGNPLAQYQLALMSFAGRGKEFNNKRAMELLKGAAEKGYSFALAKLIDIYYKKGIYKKGIEGEMIYDPKEALKWLIKAAIEDDSGAGRILGKKYFKGDEIAQDFSNAFFWFYQVRYFSKKYSLFVAPQLEEEKVLEDANDVEGDDKEHEKLEAIGANLLGNCQTMLIQMERSRLGTCAAFQIGLYKKLEEIIFKFIQWNHQLKTANGLMVNSLVFKDLRFKQAIDARQKLTGVTPYIKGHVYQGKSYISFDRAMVQLADEIMEEALNQHFYREAENILNHLKRIYEKLHAKTHKRSIDIENRYHLLGSDLPESEKKKFLQKLEIENKLGEVYTNKLKYLEEQIGELRTYYQALFRQIEKGSVRRNKNFKQERDMILEIEGPCRYPRTLFKFEVVEKDFSI
jgi:TPR repeat protein